MKKSHLMLVVAISAFVSFAFAEIPTSDGTPTLEFHTIPIEGSPSLGHKVTPYRFYNKMIITVWDPIQCGQKPMNAAFSIKENSLYLNYLLSTATPGAQACTLISEFSVSNLPHRDLDVNFAGGPEPYVVARLRKCPNYSPTTNDIWECLAPLTGK